MQGDFERTSFYTLSSGCDARILNVALIICKLPSLIA